jgi:hypothetical protein
MPKTQTKPESEFNKEEWLKVVKERIMKEPWGSGRLWTNGVLTVEVVRVGETEDVMLRIRTPNVRNAIKLTRKEHIDSLVELANAIVENEKNLRDKLDAIREVLRAGRGTAEEEL